MQTISRRAALSSLVAAGAGLAAACSASPTFTPTPPPGPPASASVVASPSAVAPAASPMAAASAGAQTTVKGVWVSAVMNQMLWPLAAEAGYFSQQGLDFSLSYVNGSGNGLAALFTRDVDIITAGGSAVVGYHTERNR